jgi:hypothetical protein
MIRGAVGPHTEGHRENDGMCGYIENKTRLKGGSAKYAMGAATVRASGLDYMNVYA